MFEENAQTVDELIFEKFKKPDVLTKMVRKKATKKNALTVNFKISTVNCFTDIFCKLVDSLELTVDSFRLDTTYFVNTSRNKS